MGKRYFMNLRSSRGLLPRGVIDFDAVTLQNLPKPSLCLSIIVEDGLFHNREENREKALSKIIKAFTNNTDHEVAQTKFATIMLQCLNMVKKGSANEICLATKAIGLLAIIIGPGDDANELFEESLSTYSQILNLKSESIKVLESLVIVTWVGAYDFEGTERSMKIIWQFIRSNSDSNIVADEDSATVLATAISAWSFLFATIDILSLDHKYWQEVTSYLLNLLEKEESLRGECAVALAIIFEKGCVEKLSSEAYKVLHKSHKEDTTSFLQEWKNEIVEQVSKACSPQWEVSKYFQDDRTIKTSLNIGGNSQTYSTLCQSKKIGFLKKLLGGEGFEKHMLENEHLQQVFNFIPNEDLSGPELYIPETEKVKAQYFSPEIRKNDCKQRLEKSPNSFASKAKTQEMKKMRIQARERKIGDLNLLNVSDKLEVA